MRYFLIILLVSICCGNQSIAAQELTISRVTQHPQTLEVEIVVKATSDKGFVGMLPNPKDIDNTKFYLTFNDKNGLLDIQRNFYEYSPAAFVSDLQTPCFALGTTGAGQVHKETIFVDYPTSQTYLPISTKIDVSKVKSIRFQLGLLPLDESIVEIPARKPFGHCAVGNENVANGAFKGKTLLETQTILKSNVVDIN